MVLVWLVWWYLLTLLSCSNTILYSSGWSRAALVISRLLMGILWSRNLPALYQPVFIFVCFVFLCLLPSEKVVSLKSAKGTSSASHALSGPDIHLTQTQQGCCEHPLHPTASTQKRIFPLFFYSCHLPDITLLALYLQPLTIMALTYGSWHDMGKRTAHLSPSLLSSLHFLVEKSKCNRQESRSQSFPTDKHDPAIQVPEHYTANRYATFLTDWYAPSFT